LAKPPHSNDDAGVYAMKFHTRVRAAIDGAAPAALKIVREQLTRASCVWRNAAALPIRVKKQVFLLLIVLAGAAAAPWLPAPSWLSSASLDAPAYRTAAVERGDVVAIVKAAGALNALVLVEVGSQISGQVKELYADFNSAVTEGQVIARLDPTMYEAKVAQAQAELEMAETLVAVQRAQIERARAELENAKAAHASAKAQTLRAEVALDDAVRELERKGSLAARGVVAPGEWERIQNAHKSAQAQVTVSRAQEGSQVAAISAAEAALDMSEAQLLNTHAQVKQKQAVLRQTQIDLERTYIRAPVTGTVVNRTVSGGQTVAASLQTPTLFTIAQDLARMQVEASIVEADVSRFQSGQPVTFTVDAHPGRLFTGLVKQIRKAPQIVQNVVTYVVVIAAENPDELLLPGMTANLQVVVAKREGVLKVPNTALRFRPPGQLQQERAVGGARAEEAGNNGNAQAASGRVFVLGRHGQPMMMPLRLGITDGRMTEVMDGNLIENQRVITGPATQAGSGADAESSLLKFRLQ
jgi:HlyD family secretion protein